MSTQITDELRVIVEAEVERAIANFRKLDDAVGATEKEASSLSDAIDKIAGKSMLLSASIGGAGIAAIKFSGDNEMLKASLEGLLKSADAADAMFSAWNQRSKETPLEMDDFAAAGKQLLAFTVSAEDVTDTMMRIGDVAAGVSKNIGEMGGNLTSIAEIYGKAKVQGRLFAEDINQFQGRGIPVVQELAKQFGVSEGAVRDLVAEGKVGFPELERAFKSMTGNGGIFEGQMKRLSEVTMGKFSTSMDNAKIAAASFGDIMLPMANDLLDASNDIFQGLSDLDDGTKRFILSFGGVVAISGPTIMALKGINTALAAMSANPMIIGITATVAGLALVTAAVQRQLHAYDDLNSNIKKTNSAAESAISAFAQGNTEKKLDATTTEELIKLYPELSGEIKSYETSAGQAADAVKKLREQKVLDATTGQLDRLKRDNEAIEKAASLYQKYADQLEKTKKIDPLEAKEGAYALSLRKREWDDAIQKSAKTAAKINANLATIGKALGANNEIIDIPVTVTPVVPTPSGGSADSLKKTWQEWFEKITDIPQKQFGDSGAKAGQLYVEGLGNALRLDQSLAQKLGIDLDLADVITSQQDDVRKAITDLLSVDKSQIDQAFTFDDASIKALVDLFRDLGTELNGLNYTKTLTGLQQKVSDLGKSEQDLAEATYRASGFTEEQTRTLTSVNAEFSRVEILKNYSVRLDEIGQSTDDLARKKLVLLGATEEELKQFDQMVVKLREADGLTSFQDYFTDGTSKMLKSWGVLDEAINTTLSDMTYQLANMSFSATLSGLTEMGKALADGADAGESMQAAMLAMAQQILDNLPMMFLQAGLQLIANGQWALGLGFIAAAGTSAVVSGYVKEKTNPDTTNAHGNVYGEGGLNQVPSISAYRNTVVDSPTTFRFAHGDGLMGEAGRPEAIVPMVRLANGDLGVQSAGGGSTVSITIINNTGAEVTKTESTSEDGSRNIEIIVGQMVVSTIENGKADKALTRRFEGIRPRGV